MPALFTRMSTAPRSRSIRATASCTCPVSYPEVHPLSPLEARLALGEEGLDALRGVLGPERLQECAHLDLARLVDGRLEPLVNRLDDQARGDRRTLGDLPREGPGVGERLALLAQTVHEPEGQTLRRRDLRAEDQELERLRAPDQRRQPL